MRFLVSITAIAHLPPRATIPNIELRKVAEHFKDA